MRLSWIGEGSAKHEVGGLGVCNLKSRPKLQLDHQYSLCGANGRDASEEPSTWGASAGYIGRKAGSPVRSDVSFALLLLDITLVSRILETLACPRKEVRRGSWAPSSAVRVGLLPVLNE